MSLMINQDMEDDNVEQAKPEVNMAPGPQVEEFANLVDHCIAPSLSVSERKTRVLELPRKFHENATRRLLQKRLRRVADGSGDIDMDSERWSPSLTAEDLEQVDQLEKEVQTWDLVRRLLPLRFAKSRAGAPRLSLGASKHPTLRDLAETDSILKERRAVLQWLQVTASSGPDIDELARELQQSADRGDIIAHGWLHTRSSIKLRKSMTAWPHLLDRQTRSILTTHVNSDGAPLVTQLDPDAATRQDRKLEPRDEFFERSIWLGCFEHLRRGSSLKTIREWCQERTEMWRAVSASGVLLAADGKDSMADAPPESLVLWRRVCLSLSRNVGSDNYERAVYGILSGDISSVENVAKSWDDHLFANYNALVRARIDSFILGRCSPEAVATLSQSFSSFDPQQLQGDDAGFAKRLVKTLENRESTRQEAMEPYKGLQAALIADDTDTYLRAQGSLLAEAMNNDRPLGQFTPSPLSKPDDCSPEKFFGPGQHEGLRVVTHVHVLLTLMRSLDASEGKMLSLGSGFETVGQEQVVAAYTEYLQNSGLEALIPLYCSILKPPMQYEILGNSMIKEGDAETRLLQLRLMRKVGIDSLQFTQTLARLALDQLVLTAEVTVPSNSIRILAEGSPTARYGRGILPDFLMSSGKEMTTKDEYVIRSLEWLLQVQAAWPEVARIGEQAYKFFFTNQRLVAASNLVKRIKLSSVIGNMVDDAEAYSDTNILEDPEFVREKLQSIGISGASADQVRVSLRNLHDLEALAGMLDGLETVSSAMQLQVIEPPENQKDIMRIAANEGPNLKINMKPLLQSWGVASIEAGDRELADIRQAYLPEVILAFVSALHYMGNNISRDHLLEAMDLAAVVAERESDVAQVFIKRKRMTELVESLAACSKALAVVTAEKRAAGSSSKKLREMGWSRDIWVVKN
ncbi:hypothetical protein CDD82_4037 [Ophiocordyceps australis]|uniref:Nuclear pore complex protein n=1 Tax=Ophiocordyceps australis TaxID=1399860 RepID=A0A2C5Z3F0_9HYPO|nr:hypothetical protein CDD82_4037 [Ophiocordyceps australis]